jgi:hypothetical protein
MHGGFAPHKALRIAKSEGPFASTWIEEPVPQGKSAPQETAARVTTLPIASGVMIGECPGSSISMSLTLDCVKKHPTTGAPIALFADERRFHRIERGMRM